MTERSVIDGPRDLPQICDKFSSRIEAVRENVGIQPVTTGVVPRPGIEPVFPYVAKRNHSKSTLVARNKQFRRLTFGFDLFSFALDCGEFWSNLAQVLFAIARTRGQVRSVRPGMSAQGAVHISDLRRFARREKV